MKPRLSVLTLGVADLERSLRFYRDGLGLPTQGIIGTEFEHGAAAFFDLQAGVKLALFGRDDLARDAGIDGFGANPGAFSLGHNVASRAEVDAVMRQAGAAGAVVVKSAQPTFWGGYAGYLADPDGHLWEIVYNPDFIPEG
jgi:catechol 2,3-dioxygenase-like lactoylglutathione lyase family enzyme